MEPRDIPYLSLSEVVNELCVAMFNDKRKYFPNLMIHGKWIYKDLKINSEFAVQNKYVRVDKTTSPYSIVIPRNTYRFINLSEEGADGRLHSWVFDDTINETPPPTGKECEVCNDNDDYGSCVNEMVPTTVTHVIEGVPYIEKVYKRVCKNGDIEELRNIPVLDIDEDNAHTVKYITKRRILAHVEVKSCGCVKKIPSNLACINDVCGCMVSSRICSMAQPTITKVGTKQGRMKISGGRIWLSGNVPDFLILTTQTNGVCGEESLMIHEAYVNSLMFGIKWRAKAFSGKDARQDRIDYDRAVGELDMFLNPIRAEEFMAIQMTLPKWGGLTDQSCMQEDFWGCCDFPAGTSHTGGGVTMEQVRALIEESKDECCVVNNYTYNVTSGAYEFVQPTPAMVWLIVHPLGFNPSVVTVNGAGDEIVGEITYPSDNISVRVTFNTPVSGKAYLS